MFDVRCSMFDVRCSMFDVLKTGSGLLDLNLGLRLESTESEKIKTI